MDYNSLQSKLTLLNSQLNGAESLVIWYYSFWEMSLQLLMNALSVCFVVTGIIAIGYIAKWAADHQHRCFRCVLHLCCWRLRRSTICKLLINGDRFVSTLINVYTYREWIYEMDSKMIIVIPFGQSVLQPLCLWYFPQYAPSYISNMLRFYPVGSIICQSTKLHSYRN